MCAFFIIYLTLGDKINKLRHESKSIGKYKLNKSHKINFIILDKELKGTKEVISEIKQTIITQEYKFNESLNTINEDLKEEVQSIKFNIKSMQEGVKTLNSQVVQHRDQLASQDLKIENNY